MTLIGDDYTTGDGLSLGVSLVLLEIPDEAWIKQVLISAFNTLTLEGNWNDDYGDITSEEATRIMSLMLQTLQFDYEPPIPMIHPIGSIIMHAANVIPDEWLICDGQAYSRTTYAELFAMIGTDYGAGDGTTTFNIPDLRDLSPMGAGGSVVVNPGTVQGALTVALTTAQLPAHNHGITDPGHTHRVPKPTATVDAAVNVATNLARTDNTATPHIITNSNTTGITVLNTGGGNAHDNLHPVMGLTFLIFAGV